MNFESGEACRLSGSSDDLETIKKILNYKTIAVVGCSPKPERPSHSVAAYLKEEGYKIIPVNPGHKEILGEKCYASLLDIPEPVDIVDVFRRSEEVLPLIDEAIAIKAKALWLQDGISHPEGEARAKKAGLLVISNDCLGRRRSQLKS